jgi:hypothetical protein
MKVPQARFSSKHRLSAGVESVIPNGLQIHRTHLETQLLNRIGELLCGRPLQAKQQLQFNLEKAFQTTKLSDLV